MADAELDTTDWAAFETSLATHLSRLENEGFVSIHDGLPLPAAATETDRPGLLGRLFGKDRPEPDPGVFVQAQRAGDYVYIECVGDRSFGGRHDWTAQQQEQLARIGWLHDPELIGEKVYVPATPDAPELHGNLPLGEVATGARIMVATLRDVVGVTSPATLDISHG